MHHKPVFALAGVFLAVAIVVPTVLLAQNQLIIIQNPVGMQTSGNVSSINPQQIQQSYIDTLIIVGIVEVVFVALFVVTMYNGIKHVHPYH